MDYEPETLPAYLDTLGDPPLEQEWPYAPEDFHDAKVDEDDQPMMLLDSLNVIGSCHMSTMGFFYVASI